MFLDCSLTDDRENTIAELAEKGRSSPTRCATTPTRHWNGGGDIRDHILRVRDAIGLTYFCLRGPDVESLAPIVGELTGGQRETPLPQAWS